MKLPGGDNLRKRVYIISLLFVFCHIAFDLLDLDLSNFPLKSLPREKESVITSASAEAAELVKAVKADSLRTQPVLVQPSVFHDRPGIYQTQLVMNARIHKTRTIFRRVIPQSTGNSSPVP